jgi:hypothetical protein
MTFTANAINEYFASFAGCDGGNLGADVWVCGIEHGGEFDPLKEGIEPDLEPSSWTEEYKQQHPKYTTWQYNQKVAKLMVALRHIRNNEAPVAPPSEWCSYIKDELYTSDGESFKLNLFPFSAPSTNDPNWKDAYPGLGDRANYRKLCQEQRFPFFVRKRKEQRPKVIVGTGITYVDDFSQAFGFPSESRTEFQIQYRDTHRDCFKFSDSGSTLIVCPFFGGRYGVNSNGLLMDLARHVAKATI